MYVYVCLLGSLIPDLIQLDQSNAFRMGPMRPAFHPGALFSWIYGSYVLVDGPLNQQLVGGLEHEFYFSIYWE